MSIYDCFRSRFIFQNVNEIATKKGFKSEQEDDKSEVDEIDDKTPAKKEVKKRSISKKGANTPGRSKLMII